MKSGANHKFVGCGFAFVVAVSFLAKKKFFFPLLVRFLLLTH